MAMLSEVEDAKGQQAPNTALHDVPSGQPDVDEHIDTGRAPEPGQSTEQREFTFVYSLSDSVQHPIINNERSQSAYQS